MKVSIEQPLAKLVVHTGHVASKVEGPARQDVVGRLNSVATVTKVGAGKSDPMQEFSEPAVSRS